MTMPGSAALTGTGMVADDLYLMAHHLATGRPQMHPRALGTGLTGALLAELVLSGNIRIVHGTLMVTRGPLPEDGLARMILGELARHGRWRSARDRLALLARTLAGGGVRRLVRCRFLRQGIVGQGLKACGLEVALEVYPDHHAFDVVREVIAVSPNRSQNAKVRINDNGLLTWDRDYCPEFAAISCQPQFSWDLSKP